MRFKVFSLFIVLQAFYLGLWVYGPSQGYATKTEAFAAESLHTASEPMQSNVRFAAQNINGNPLEDTKNLEQEANLVLSKLPQDHYKTLRNVVFDFNPDTRRGLGGKSLIILRAVRVSSTERMAVMIHEIGHSLDLGSLTHLVSSTPSEFKDGKNPIYESDPSLDFYRISWQDEFTPKVTASNLDFVSGYAMSDPFEDFAETYAFYILHGKTFRIMTGHNDALAQKYTFMRDVVFEGKEFEMGQEFIENVNRRPWDVTALEYDLAGFLAS